MMSFRSCHQEGMASRVQRAGLLLETPGANRNRVSVIQIHVFSRDWICRGCKTHRILSGNLLHAQCMADLCGSAFVD